jgi:hypothetical protein
MEKITAAKRGGISFPFREMRNAPSFPGFLNKFRLKKGAGYAESLGGVL